MTDVAVRCPYGYPAVIETVPYLEDGSPFPTLLYLTCPSAVAVVSRSEERGGVEEWRRAVRDDPLVAEALAALADTYTQRRRQLAPEEPQVDGGAVLESGIGGPDEARATCLHAYVAALLAAETGWLDQNAGGGAGGTGNTTGPGDTAESAFARGPGRRSGLGRDTQTMRQGVWARLLESFGRLWCEDERCAAYSPSGGRRAAIDIGTNSVRLLVADVSAAGVRSVVREARVTRLGEGVGVSGRLLPGARARTAEVVDRFVEEARRMRAEVIRLAGTSACREAVDGLEFVAELGRRHAVEARVLTGEEEGFLAFRGATLELSGTVVLLDVGGGSSELVTSDENGQVVTVSLPLGCVRGTEEWFHEDPPTRAERAAARRHVGSAARSLRAVFGAVPEREGETGHALVGVAGTVTTLACLAFGLTEYGPDRIHLQRLTCAAISAVVDGLAAKTMSERAALPCMQPGRAEVIVAGGEIVLALMAALGYEELVVSERDMLDGIVLADEFAESAPA